MGPVTQMQASRAIFGVVSPRLMSSWSHHYALVPFSIHVSLISLEDVDIAMRAAAKVEYIINI